MEKESRNSNFGHFVADMPPEMRAAVEAAGSRVRYGDGETIHQRGDSRPGLSIIVKGAVRLNAGDSEGEVTSIGILRPGDCFGEMTLFIDIPRSLDALALGDTVINQLSRASFLHLLDAMPDMRDHLLAGLARQLSLTLELLNDQRRLPPDVRLAKLLMQMAERDDGKLVARSSQSGLAEALATSRVTAGKALNSLADQGLVEIGYRKVVIAERKALGRWIAERDTLVPLVEQPEN